MSPNALEELLKELFDDSELRRWLAMIAPPEALHELPGSGVGYSDVVHRCVKVLKRRRLVNSTLYESLRAARPNQAQRISAVEQQMLVSSLGSGYWRESDQLGLRRLVLGTVFALGLAAAIAWLWSERQTQAVVLCQSDDMEQEDQEGKRIRGTGNFKGLSDFAEEMIVRCPSNWRGHNLLGQARIKLGDTSGAIQSFQRAQELCPYDPKCIEANRKYNLAEAYLEAGGEYDAVALDLLREYQAAPSNVSEPSGWVTLGLAEMYMGNHETAQRMFRRAKTLMVNDTILSPEERRTVEAASDFFLAAATLATDTDCASANQHVAAMAEARNRDPNLQWFVHGDKIASRDYVFRRARTWLNMMIDQKEGCVREGIQKNFPKSP